MVQVRGSRLIPAADDLHGSVPLGLDSPFKALWMAPQVSTVPR